MPPEAFDKPRVKRFKMQRGWGLSACDKEHGADGADPSPKYPERLLRGGPLCNGDSESS